jgi:hypothetical protein
LFYTESVYTHQSASKTLSVQVKFKNNNGENVIFKFTERSKLILGLCFSALLLMGVIVAGTGCTQEKTPIKVGFAQQEISTIGLLKPGYSVHDTCYAKVIWVEDPRQPFGIVTLDLINLTDSQCAAVRESISDSLGIPEAKVIVCASHTHSGTYYKGGVLAGRIGSIAREARQASKPARIGFSRVSVGPEFVVNRRIRINEQLGDLTMVFSENNKTAAGGKKLDVRGQVVDFFLHGAQIYGSDYADKGSLGNADSAKASEESKALVHSLPEEMTLDGPVDPHLEALCFKDQSGKTIGTLLRFACHPTIFRGSRTKQYSADYPGVLASEISRATGGAPVHFMQGPCGNTKPSTVDFGEKYLMDFGKRLAGMIIEEIKNTGFDPLEETFWKHERQSFACAPDMAGITEEMSTEAEEKFKVMASAPFSPYELKKLHDWSVRAWSSQYMSRADSLRLPFTAIGFNQTAIVTMPGEVFCQHGMNIKDRFPGKCIMVVELTDAKSPKYIPTREAFPRGGYEVGNSALPAGSGERMVEICSGLLKGLFE